MGSNEQKNNNGKITALIGTVVKKVQKARARKQAKQTKQSVPVKRTSPGAVSPAEMSADERRRRMRAREQRLRRRRRVLLIKMGMGLLLIILAIVLGVNIFVVKPRQEREKRLAEEAKAVEKLIAKADQQAAMYDYDAAI